MIQKGYSRKQFETPFETPCTIRVLRFIERELGIDSAYSIINRMSANARVKCAVQDLGTKKERLSAKSRILHDFAKRLRVE